MCGGAASSLARGVSVGGFAEAEHRLNGDLARSYEDRRVVESVGKVSIGPRSVLRRIVVDAFIISFEVRFAYADAPMAFPKVRAFWASFRTASRVLAAIGPWRPVPRALTSGLSSNP